MLKISPTVVIDTSIESSSWVVEYYCMKTLKSDFLLKKRSKLNFDLKVLKCWNHPSFINISPTVVINSYMIGYVFMRITAWKPKKLILFLKILTFVFLPSCFLNNFWLILLTLIGLLSYAIHKHSSRSQNTSVLSFNFMHIMFRKNLLHWTFIL